MNIPPYLWGAGVHLEYLGRELANLVNRQHAIIILCFGKQQLISDNVTVQGISPDFTFSFQDPRHLKVFDVLLRNLFMAGVLQEADILHCHTWYTHFAGCLLKQLMGITLVLTTHSLEPQRSWKAEQLGSAYKAAAWLEKTAYRNADGVIAVSRAMQHDVHALYGVPLQKIRVIHNGIDTNRYKPTSAPAVLNRMMVCGW